MSGEDPPHDEGGIIRSLEPVRTPLEILFVDGVSNKLLQGLGQLPDREIVDGPSVIETLMPVAPSPSPSVSRQTKPGERSARRLIASTAPMNSAMRSLSMSSTGRATLRLDIHLFGSILAP